MFTILTIVTENYVTVMRL